MADLGTDFAGSDDLDPALTMQTDRRALADAIIRRLTTARGGLPDYPQYGFDVSSLIGSVVTPNAVAQRVLEQVRAEEEVEEASCDVTQSTDGTTLTITIKVVSSVGPFDLTIDVNDLEFSAIIPGV